MIKKAMLRGLFGYLGGCIIGLIFSLQHQEFRVMEALPQILPGGIPGAIAMGSTVVYDIEKWSLFRATATHFLIAMGAILLASFALHWFEPWSTPFWIMLAAELAAYILIWLIMYLLYRGQVRKLNELLAKSRKRQGKETGQ